MPNEIIKSIEDAMNEIDLGAEDNFNKDIETESIEKSVKIDLEKAEDNVNSKEIVTDEFMLEVARTHDQNIARVARALEASVSLTKSLGHQVVVLTSEIDKLNKTVDAMAAQPNQAQAALTSLQAEQMRKGVADPKHVSVPEDSTVIDPGKEPKTFGEYRRELVNVLRKGFDERVDGWETLGNDVSTMLAVPGEASLHEALNMLSRTSKVFLKSMREEEESEVL